MTKEAIELKPCPFCGGNSLEYQLSDIEGWIAHVLCTDCDDMLGPMSECKYDDQSEAKEDAAKAWNRRPAGVTLSRELIHDLRRVNGRDGLLSIIHRLEAALKGVE